MPNAPADVHQKIDEIIIADERKDLKVSTHQHGADLKGAKGECYEVKVSVCTTRARTCNFNWPIPNKGKDTERRTKLLESITAKTKSGGAILRINDGKAAKIAEYEFSHDYLVGYFQRIKLGESNNHNMGCQRCSSCKGFHRLERMKYVDKQVRKNCRRVDWEMDNYSPTCPKDK